METKHIPLIMELMDNNVFKDRKGNTQMPWLWRFCWSFWYMEYPIGLLKVSLEIITILKMC